MESDKEYMIILFLQRKLSPEGLQEFESWRRASDTNRRMVDDYRAIWELTGGVDRNRDFQTEEEWEKVSSVIEDHSRVKLYHRSWFRAAAAILFVLLSSGMLYMLVSNNDQIIIQTADITSHTVLPDGSECWLNKNSRAVYNKDFQDDRALTLSGEAFFKISADAEKPFVIATRDATIRVLGTSFNVMAYDHRIETEVFVLTGKVSMAPTDESEKIVLMPGSVGILNRKEQTLVAETDPHANSLAWKDRQLVFKKTPMRKVLKVLGSYFQKEIKVSDPALLDCRFTGSFNDPSLEEVFETLSIALNLKITVDHGEYKLDGRGCDEN